MIDYDPKDAVTVWPEADYDAVLKNVEEKTSKTSGNQMEVWTFEVYNDDGRKQTIWEYVTATAAYKIKQLAVALGRKSEFDARKFHAENHIGAGVKLALFIDEQLGYEDKNKIGRIKPADAPAASEPAPPPGRQSFAEQNGNRSMKQDILDRRQPISSPVGSDQQFRDEDIPF